MTKQKNKQIIQLFRKKTLRWLVNFDCSVGAVGRVKSCEVPVRYGRYCHRTHTSNFGEKSKWRLRYGLLFTFYLILIVGFHRN